MWKILTGLSFSRLLILTMPSLEKLPWMTLLYFNFLQFRQSTHSWVSNSHLQVFSCSIKLSWSFLCSQNAAQLFSETYLCQVCQTYGRPQYLDFHKSISISQNVYHWLFQDVFRNSFKTMLLWNLQLYQKKKDSCTDVLL